MPDTQTTQSANDQLQSLVTNHITGFGNGVTSLLQQQHAPDQHEVVDFFQTERQASKQLLKTKMQNIVAGKTFKELKTAINELCREVDRYTDLQMGIVRTTSDHPEIAFIGNDTDSKSHVIVRDARLQASLQESSRVDKADKVPEATIAIAAGNLRGILRIIQDAEIDTRFSEAPSSKRVVSEQALNVFQKYQESILNHELSQQDRNSLVKQMNYEMVEVLAESNLILAGAKLGEFTKNKQSRKVLLEGIGYVRDLTNLNDEPHCSIVTISSALGNEGPQAKEHHIEASIPVKPLSGELQKYYNDEPYRKKWEKQLNPFLKNSMFAGNGIRPITSKILDGKHMISSQLPVPGLRNAYLECAMVINAESGAVSLQDNILRSGTPAYNHGKDPKDLTSIEITKQNIAHLKGLCKGSVDVISLNSPINEAGIVDGVSEGIKAYNTSNPEKEVAFTNLPISVGNKARNLIEVWNRFKNQAQNSIKAISCKSGKDRTAAAILQAFLKKMKIHLAGDIEGSKVDATTRGKIDYARQQIVNAGHGNAVAANVGATIGINGTKIGNVFAGLNALRKLTFAHKSVLGKYQGQLRSHIASLNKFDTETPPTLKGQKRQRVLDVAKDIVEGSAQSAPSVRQRNLIAKLLSSRRGGQVR